MNVTDLLLQRGAFHEGRRKCHIVGVCGRAGSGKTTFASRVRADLQSHAIHAVVYSGDWRVNADVKARKITGQKARGVRGTRRLPGRSTY